MPLTEQKTSNTMTSSTSSNTSSNSISQDNQHNNYNNNNYYTHGAGRFLTAEQGEAIKTAYIENVGDNLPGAVAHMIERAFNSGLTAEEIVMAIEETGFAPRPSPWYLKKVLENWVENGVTISRIRHEISANRGSPWWK